MNVSVMPLAEKMVNFRETLIKSVNVSKVAIHDDYPRTWKLMFIEHLSNFEQGARKVLLCYSSHQYEAESNCGVHAGNIDVFISGMP